MVGAHMLKRIALARMVPIKLEKMRLACGADEMRRGGMIGFSARASTQINVGKAVAAMARDVMTNGWDPV